MEEEHWKQWNETAYMTYNTEENGKKIKKDFKIANP